MRVETRVLEKSQLGDAFELDRQVFQQPKSRRERWLAFADPERMHGVFVDGRLAALTQVHAFGQFFGGRSVPMGGVAAVATAPEQRGKGFAKRALVAGLHAMRDRGESISTLHPATTQLYRGLGWEVAGLFAWWRLPTAALLDLRPAPDKPVRRATKDDLPGMKQCYARFARGVNGLLDRPDALWSWRPDWDEDDQYVYVSLADGGDIDGYVVYHQRGRPDSPGYRIAVRDLAAENEGALRALWRVVGTSSTQAEQVFFPGPPQHPLHLLLPEQRIEPVGRIHWMLRLVDAAGAIRERGFPPGLSTRVELELLDPTGPWNQGRYVLEVSEGRGQLEKGGAGTLRLAIGAFASLYTGWSSTQTLRGTGMLEGGGAADLAALDAAFAGPAPWLLDEF